MIGQALTATGFLLAALAGPQGAPPVALALTDEEVRVTSGFTGARLVIYGVAPAYEPGDDLAVVLRGPDQLLRVMRKRRAAGVWVNAAPVIFPGAPSYYAVATTRELEDIAPPNVLSSLGVGADYVPLRPAARTTQTAAELREYRDAVVRLKSQRGLYRNEEGGVRIQEANLFRAEALLPAAAPVGQYQAQAILFRDGAEIGRQSALLEVRRAGLGRVLYEWAQTAGLAYGLISVAIALFAGWAAATAFRGR